MSNQIFKKIKVVINPGSGRGAKLPGFLARLIGVKSRKTDTSKNSDSYQNQILNSLRKFGLNPDISLSYSSREATEIARRCTREGYDLVIAAGGDGTINSIINGLSESETALGVIPLGTLNLFALQFNIPLEIPVACEMIAKGTLRTIDLGVMNGRFFSIVCGIGFDAYVISRASKALKRKLGAGAYIITGIKSLLKYRFRSIHFLLDDKPPIHTDYIVIISNGKYYSSNMFISDKASPNDGLLDVIGFQKRNSLSILRYIWELKGGNLTELPDVEYFQAQNIRLLPHGHHKIHLDGEPIGYTPALVSVAPSAIRIVC